MAGMNPLILRELVQSSHHRRTYWLRAALPAAAGIIVAPQVFAVIAAYGYDWRSISNIARPVFASTAWMQLIVFGLLAVVYGIESLQLEWSRRTMELLCTTPISARGIVWGKFVSVLCRIFLIGLALLPVMMVWWRMGHIPPALALGSLGIIASSTIMCAALAVLIAAFHCPGRSTWVLPLVVIVALHPICGAAVMVYRDHPLLVAAAPPWAFDYVMSDATPQGMGATAFTLLAIIERLAIAALALWVAPAAFRRSFNRFEAGARGFSTGWRGRLARALRRFSSRRPPLGDEQDPFEWQEMGAGTFLLRWSVWLTYLMAGIIMCIGGAVEHRNFREIFSDQRLYLAVAGMAAGVLIISSAIYGVNVFAREKERRTADALILTGNLGEAYFRGKLKAAYRALRWPLASVAVMLILAARSIQDEDSPWGLIGCIAAWSAVGPGVAALIGMTFGAVARSRWHAGVALIMSPVLLFCIVAGVMIFFGPIGFLVAVIALILGIRCLPTAWMLWRLSLMLGWMLALGVMLSGVIGAVSPSGWAAVAFMEFFLLCGVLAMAGYYWYSLGACLFDLCMLNLADQPSR